MVGLMVARLLCCAQFVLIVLVWLAHWGGGVSSCLAHVVGYVSLFAYLSSPVSFFVSFSSRCLAFASRLDAACPLPRSAGGSLRAPLTLPVSRVASLEVMFELR